MTKYALVLALILPIASQARLIQILFTNDIHGNVEQYKGFEDRGGYARIKHIIDVQKEEAKQNDIESIVLDGGDFLEGNISYMANNTNSLMDIHNSLGYDAVVLGNHDYLMGESSLRDLLNKTPPNFELLAANIKFKKKYKDLNNKIKSYTIIQKNNIKVGIVGVTTNEKFYTFRMKKAKFKNPKSVANKVAGEIKDKVDFTIALTHIGFSSDKSLAYGSRDIDLIVGAHSHTKLSNVHYARNADGFKVPIVQSGSEGHYVGRILIDASKRHNIKVIEYELISTYKSEKDDYMQSKVEQLDEQLNDEYGEDWLNETIGQSNLSYDDYYNSKKAWGVFIAESIKEASGADIGLHATEFAGGMFPVGNITRKEVFNSYPRVFEIHQRKGWKIYKFNVYGWLLSPIIKIVAKYNNSVYLTGLKFDYKRKRNGKIKIKRIYINGKKLRKFKKYSLGVPEGIVKGAMGISKILTRMLTTRIKETPIYIWDTLNSKIKNTVGMQSNIILNNKKSYTVIEKEEGR